MRKTSFIIFTFCILLGVSLAACAPQGEAGIEVPLVVKRVDILVREVEMLNTLVGELEMDLASGEIKATTITPVNPYDTFLFIEATTTYKGIENPCTWSGEDTVRVSFEKDGIQAFTDLFDCSMDYDQGFMRFYFPAYRQGGSNYRLLLPKDKSISLDGLLP